MDSRVHIAVEEGDGDARGNSDKHEPSDIFRRDFVALAEYVAYEDGRYRPTCSSNDVVKGEYREAYTSGSGNERHERSHERIEPSDDDGFSRMPMNETSHRLETLLIEKESFSVLHNEIASIPSSYRIPNEVTENGSEGSDDTHAPQIEDADFREESSYDNDRMPGNECSDNRKRLKGGREENHPVSPMVKNGSRKREYGVDYRHWFLCCVLNRPDYMENREFSILFVISTLNDFLINLLRTSGKSYSNKEFPYQLSSQSHG